jgi:hypothetical protein
MHDPVFTPGKTFPIYIMHYGCIGLISFFFKKKKMVLHMKDNLFWIISPEMVMLIQSLEDPVPKVN